jgi:hypothetical protein
MPQVHIRRVRYAISRESVAAMIQQYTGMSILDARRAADDAVAGKPTAIYVDDFSAVYELADMLTSLGVEAEADESDD